MPSSKEFFINLEVESEERFDLAKFMEFLQGDNHDPLTSSVFNNIRSLEKGGQYRVSGEDGKPDLISYRIYGDTQYWWIILAYNGKTSYLDIKNGEELIFPTIVAIEDFYFSLKINQNVQDKDV